MTTEEPNLVVPALPYTLLVEIMGHTSAIMGDLMQQNFNEIWRSQERKAAFAFLVEEIFFG